MNGGGMKSFVARFAEVSSARIRDGRQSVGARGGDLERIARELHSMAGEAGLLGLTEVMAFARAAEQAAIALATNASSERWGAMEAALDDVETALFNATRGMRPESRS